MALNIKDEETDRLARRLAAETGESITQATRTALQERLARVSARRSPDSTVMHEIVARGRRRRVLDPRTPEEILGYDQDGLPA